MSEPVYHTWHFCTLHVVGGTIYAIPQGAPIPQYLEHFATSEGVDVADAYIKWYRKTHPHTAAISVAVENLMNHSTLEVSV